MRHISLRALAVFILLLAHIAVEEFEQRVVVPQDMPVNWNLCHLLLGCWVTRSVRRAVSAQSTPKSACMPILQTIQL